MNRSHQNLCECIFMNRLLHVIEGTGAQPFHRRFNFAGVGQQYDRTGRTTIANLFHQHDPVLFGQKKICNHDIGLRHVEGG